jgi:hypothetical protein
MDAIKPNATFVFTQVNSKKFKSVDHIKTFKSKHYNIPDYWFKTEEDLLLFSQSLKDSKTFINYFTKCVSYAVENNLESFIACTLRTNTNIIFVLIEHTNYIESIDKMIDLNASSELYEECSKLVLLKKHYETEFINSGKTQSYEAYEFWKPLYPNFLY